MKFFLRWGFVKGMMLLWLYLGLILILRSNSYSATAKAIDLHTHDDSNKYCNQTKNEYVCNCETIECRVTITNRPNTENVSLIIKRAASVKLNVEIEGYSDISIIDSDNIELVNSNYSYYPVQIERSNATNINLNSKYFKAVESKIDTLNLNVTEFDIINCKINSFTGIANDLSPSILLSYIKNMNVTIEGKGNFKMNNTVIQQLDYLIYTANKKSSISNSIIKNINENSVNINSGTLLFRNCKINSMKNNSFIINNGKLVFDNVLSDQLHADKVGLKGGEFEMYYTINNEKIKVNIKSLTNQGNTTFKPLSYFKLNNQDDLQYIIIFGAVCLVLLLIIMCLMVVLFLKKRPRYKMETMVSEKEKNANAYNTATVNSSFTQPSVISSITEDDKKPMVLKGDINEEEITDVYEMPIENSNTTKTFGPSIRDPFPSKFKLPNNNKTNNSVYYKPPPPKPPPKLTNEKLKEKEIVETEDLQDEYVEPEIPESKKNDNMRLNIQSKIKTIHKPPVSGLQKIINTNATNVYPIKNNVSSMNKASQPNVLPIHGVNKSPPVMSTFGGSSQKQPEEDFEDDDDNFYEENVE